MFDFLLSEEEKALKAEARRFAKEDVPSSLIRDMDGERVRFPKEFLQKAASRNLLGLRFSPVWGGRGAKWAGEVAALEEIGVLGSSLSCLYSLVSIVGEALHLFGTEEQKETYLKPTLQGKLCCAEALTEPRGGSDFFGATTLARRDGNDYILNGQKRFVVGAEGADYFLVYARTAEDAPAHQSISAFLVDRDSGVEVKHVYGLLGSRGGGTGRIYFRDVRVPGDHRIGPEHGGALVFNRMMVPERLTTAAASLGMARSCLEIAARVRTHLELGAHGLSRAQSRLRWPQGRRADGARGADQRRVQPRLEIHDRGPGLRRRPGRSSLQGDHREAQSR